MMSYLCEIFRGKDIAPPILLKYLQKVTMIKESCLHQKRITFYLNTFMESVWNYLLDIFFLLFSFKSRYYGQILIFSAQCVCLFVTDSVFSCKWGGVCVSLSLSIFFDSDNIGLKVPKCEIFDPFFYTNKSDMGRWLEDWRFFFSKTMADIRHFVFFAYAECALKNCLRRLSVR